jgi:N-acetyl sugar amidotransferase
MDASDPEISFDMAGICNHCVRYEKRVKNELHSGEQGERKLSSLLETIKQKTQNREYDCIIGVSGGVDSTMVAYLAKKRFGLNPLAVHLDNGWNSELAVNNIHKTLELLDIDLYTHVIDWEEFKDLQLSFLKSSFINAEIPTDHAIFALLFQIAAKKKIPYILGGSNIVTEGILASSWVYDHKDWRLIKGIHKKFGSKKLKTYPHYGMLQLFYYVFFKRIKYIPILNFVEYDKNEAMDIIQNELEWVYYGGKHYESIYTRFYQSYILPEKYGVDKRKAHLSTLIMSGQLKREDAIGELQQETYPKDLMEEDKEYVIKKLGLNEDEFNEIMKLPIRSYKEYPNSSFFYQRLSFIVKLAKQLTTYNR